MPDLTPPTLADVYAARRTIDGHVHRTPLRKHPGLGDLLGADVWVKHENFQVLGSFKPRGGLNLIGNAPVEERERGYVTASTGNHGQSISNAARTFGSTATVVVPERANPSKVAAMEALGARVVKHGATVDRSVEHGQELARETGARYVHHADEPLLIAGVATYSLEIHEDLGEIDDIIVPVGGGSGASGACIVSAALSPATRIIGVQAGAAPAVHHAWSTGRFEEQPMRTAAEGLATGRAHPLPVGILRDRLHDFVLVAEEEMETAVEAFIRHTHSLVEHAGAAPLAAALKLADVLKGRRVVLVASGVNLTMEELRQVLGS